MPAPPRKRPWSQPLADLVGTLIDPVLARQGFGESDIILHWDDIVGTRLAAVSRPLQLKWPPRPPGRTEAPQPATLIVRVESAFAIELQHRAEQVLARINAHLGWRCVGKLAFRQGPVEVPVAAPTRGRAPEPAALEKAAAGLTGFEDEGLRAALARLGAHTAAGNKAGRDLPSPLAGEGARRADEGSS